MNNAIFFTRWCFTKYLLSIINSQTIWKLLYIYINNFIFIIYSCFSSICLRTCIINNFKFFANSTAERSAMWNNPRHWTWTIYFTTNCVYIFFICHWISSLFNNNKFCLWNNCMNFGISNSRVFITNCSIWEISFYLIIIDPWEKKLSIIMFKFKNNIIIFI